MSAEASIRTLGRYLEGLSAGKAAAHLNLTLITLSGNGQPVADYILASEALESGRLKITEVGQSGTVPELLVTSTVEGKVLLLDGEELIGAKQNRILNTTILLAAMAQTKIPVSCVEQGRWHHTAPDFQTGSYAPAKMRGRKSRDVTKNLKASGEARSDQRAVWQEVAFQMEVAGVHSETRAFHEIVTARSERIGGYLDALTCPEGARGVAVAIDGRFVALDVFDKPETLRKVWERLVTGYAIDAITEQRSDGDAKCSPGNVAEVLRRASEVPCEAFPSVGLGEDWRFAGRELVGQALVAEGACVHLSVFPGGEDRSEDGVGGRIAPPSRRRRRTATD